MSDLPQNVLSYVTAHTVPAESGRKCVDGRYSSTQAKGMISRAGGDFGYVLALLSLKEKKNLDWSPEQCFDLVFDALTKMNQPFYMHTDHHADPTEEHSHTAEKPLLGCGHIAKAALFPDMYEVDANNVKRVIAYARERIAKGDNIVNMNLDGEHQELAVLVNTKTNTAVLPSDDKSKEMYFMYDKTRDDAFMQELFNNMEAGQITFEELRSISDKQLSATLDLLAKGKAVYTI